MNNWLILTAAGTPRFAGKGVARLFDRSGHYAEWLQSASHAQQNLAAASDTQVRKWLRQLDQQLQGIVALDFFPTDTQQRAKASMQALQRTGALRQSPNEPAPTQQTVARLHAADFQGQLWATRRRPWVDRLACARLVTRCVDKSPRFAWLAQPTDCPSDAVGFDFDGARFSHVGKLCSFQVMQHASGLTQESGLQHLHADDDALLQAALPVWDALLAQLSQASS